MLHLQWEALGALLGQLFSCYKPTELHWGQFGFVKSHELRADVFVFHCPLSLALRLIQSLHLKGRMEHSPQVEGDTGMEQVEQVGWMPLTAIPLLQKSPWEGQRYIPEEQSLSQQAMAMSWPRHPPVCHVPRDSSKHLGTRLLSSATD